MVVSGESGVKSGESSSSIQADASDSGTVLPECESVVVKQPVKTKFFSEDGVVRLVKGKLVQCYIFTVKQKLLIERYCMADLAPDTFEIMSFHEAELKNDAYILG